ncbi:hypothetical protein LUZ61_004155 [Rhynchospora tenuis]|uniref:Clp R domain-containing protein n=1 Tax=Rhynchospora tenuis TaxID=198213 RepID=A0AAD6ETJ2_9POAL|nr:hypothetical protein LUZ61_004155 [Rhynchospora tenuis]
MRAGGCTVQQSLTPEATAIVKQAVTLARRRGHAQVTPLHVASTMLSSSTGLLRAACLKSHSHPLQCKALELCFNVALNRLPASASPILSPHSHHMHGHHHFNPPITLSNALVAAFKRAQANQRRGGSTETQQQQPVLTIKIELEQLIISILDDPSVSRVMREAGFSSTQVKSHVEEACTKSSTTTSPNPNPRNCSNTSLSSPTHDSKSITLDEVRSEDVISVLDCLSSANKRRVVVVGESLASTEGVARTVIERIKKGEVDERISNLHFINFQIYPFRHLIREEVDQKLGEIKSIVRSYTYGKGVVLVLEDLKWVSEFWAGYVEKGRNSYYCPIEHVIMEIRNLVLGGINGGERVWFIGVGTYQSYTKCRSGVPSLETLWGLHAITIPTGGLGLSLTFDCDSVCKTKAKESKGNTGTCWSLNLDADSHLTSSSYDKHTSMASNLPSWLHKYKEENSRTFEGSVQLNDSSRKLNPLSSHSSKLTLNFTTISPTSSLSSFDQRYSEIHRPWVFNVETKHPWKSSREPGLEQCVSLKPSPNHSSSSSSGTNTFEREPLPKFKELNAENLKILCNALEKKVPWQKEIIPDVASIVLQCRSGLVRRKGKSGNIRAKEDTWLFFQGGDNNGKERIARELASLVFGSHQDNFTLIGLGSCSSTRSGFTDDDQPTKRARLEANQVYSERLFEALRENPHRVVLMEDIEQTDNYCQMAIKDAIESGKVRSKNGNEVCVGDAIIILSCESFDSRSRACSPPIKKMSENEEGKEVDGEEFDCSSLDLNLSVVDEMECSFDDIELLQAVDQALFFRLPEDSS